MKTFMEKWASTSTKNDEQSVNKEDIEEDIDTFNDIVHCDMDLKINCDTILPIDDDFEGSEGFDELNITGSSQLQEMSDDEDEVINSESDDTEFMVFPISVEQADEVCIKLNDLIKMGRIPKDKILYKFLNDITSIMINPNHNYDTDVIEFFNSIKYLGGEKTVNFIRGPMWDGTGKGGTHKAEDVKMNFGGPSKPTRQKHTSGYTIESGIVKPWLESFLVMAITDPEVQPFLETNIVKIYGLSFANDGTALKPSIEFDEVLQVNVGLQNPIKYSYVNENPKPDPGYLKNNVVTEANVSFISTIDNRISIPVAVRYKPKAGKTGEDMKEQFLSDIKVLQTCFNCIKDATSHHHILTEQNVSRCKSECEDCISLRGLCEACTTKQQSSWVPSMRACSICLEKEVQCIKGVVLVLTADCEQGNKNAFELIEENRLQDILASHYLFAVLPDAVHVGKSIKASFANWPLILQENRSCLALLHTLWDNDKEFKRLLPRNSVVNKDRMDVDCIIHLTKESVLSKLATYDNIVHTLLPDKYKINDSNKSGLYPHPIVVTVGKSGYLYVLDKKTKDSSTRLLLLRHHVPSEITVLQTFDDARSMAYLSNHLLVCEHRKSIKFYPPNIARLDVQKMKKNELQKECQDRDLDSSGTNVMLRQRLTTHLKTLEDNYKSQGIDLQAVKLSTNINPSLICKASDDMIFISSDVQKGVYSSCLESNGLVMTGNAKLIVQYPVGCISVNCMCVSGNSLFLCFSKHGDDGCMQKINLETNVSTNVILGEQQSILNITSLAPYDDGVVFTDAETHQVKYCKHDAVKVVAGRGDEGNDDGPGYAASFGQLSSICSEYNTMYITDAQNGKVKLISSLTGTIEFLKHLGLLYQAFGVHLKHQKSPQNSLTEAIQKVATLDKYISETVQNVKHKLNTEKVTNGPEGTVSAKTASSVSMIHRGLKHLQAVLKEFSSDDTLHMHTCLTVNVENLHAMGHFKSQCPTMLEYARNLGNEVREGIKRTVPWAAYYFTHSSSYYPVEEHIMPLSQMPKMFHLGPERNLNKDQKLEMKEWSLNYGRAVRQRTVRQQTTMYNAGTLPLYMYSKQTQHNEKVVLRDTLTEVQEPENLDNTREQKEEVEEQLSEYDSESDTVETEPLDDSSDDEERPVLNFPFRPGRVTRSGRCIKIPYKFA